MKHRLTYTAPASEAIKLEMDHATLQSYSTKGVMLKLMLFDMDDPTTGTESMTW